MTFSTDTTLPVCRKCKWYLHEANNYSLCTHPKIPPEKQEEMSLITGTVWPVKYRSCDSAREGSGFFDQIAEYFYYGYVKCGAEGKYWEPKK